MKADRKSAYTYKCVRFLKSNLVSICEIKDFQLRFV